MSQISTRSSGSGPGSAGVIITSFTADGSWTKNADTKWVQYYIWSGGGGGGSGAKFTNNAASGGGGGNTNFLVGYADASFFASPETITVGAGGTGGASQTADSSLGNPGTDGGPSSIGTKIVVTGTGTAGNGGRTSGAVTPSVGNSGGIGSFVSLTGSASSAPNAGATQPTPVFLCGTATGGGGGGIYQTTFGANGQGRAGGSISQGATVVLAGGTAGVTASANGGNGNDGSSVAPAAYITGGTGGGGGACSGNVAGASSGGTGGNGGTRGGAGGGGGGCLNSGGTSVGSGAGGNGGRGEVIIIEYL